MKNKALLLYVCLVNYLFSIENNLASILSIENDSENPDFITGNQVARIGIVKNPKSFNSTSNLTLSKASAVYAMRLVGAGYSSATFTADSTITQTVGTGVTAIGRVISYDQITGVLKYWQDRTLAGINTDGTPQTSPQYGYELTRFSSSVSGNGSFSIVGTTAGLSISTTFSGLSTTLNNRTYYLGQSFTNGLSNPEVKKYSGDIIYIDKPPSYYKIFKPKRRHKNYTAVLINHGATNQPQCITIF